MCFDHSLCIASIHLRFGLVPAVRDKGGSCDELHLRCIEYDDSDGQQRNGHVLLEGGCGDLALGWSSGVVKQSPTPHSSADPPPCEYKK